MKNLHSKIDPGVKAAIASAIEQYRQLGQSISITQDEKIVTLTADQISAILNQQNRREGDRFRKVSKCNFLYSQLCPSTEVCWDS
ncbi:MAG: hypothetical protein V7K40_24025 [Nostoc sp.]|uniref:hypothetical protein n=1 Tax=Nostoc sp. TaxID=1180 RepID=UPI002FF745B2